VTHLGQASLAAALFVALMAGLALAWRWFERNRASVATFIAARFARGEYLGLHLTVGLAASLAGLWTFSAITDDVIDHNTLTQFDVSLLTWLRAHATPTGYAVFNTISLLGSPETLGMLGVGVAALMVTQRRWIVLGAWAAAFVGGDILNLVLKLVIRRPRPPYAADFLSGTSWSFPSGHAMGSLIAYGMLAYIVLVVVRVPGRAAQVAVLLSAVLLIVAVGLSRIYLGVHYFSDVLGGYAAGVLWLSACISGLEGLRSERVPARPPGP
jgi:membrane-associated phospholipid phosphatase